ncbi:MAG TPA: AAA family ATPase [Acidimicrobiales bacterium]|nr:AAA family ATPase [Acidimicrobiales bacterium]
MGTRKAPSALVVVSGLPGTGKSTLAGLLADRMGAVALSRDFAVKQMKGPVADLDRLVSRLLGRRRRGFQERANRWLNSEIAGVLDGGRPVVVEVVTDGRVRRQLQALCTRHEAVLCPIEMVCSDRDEHLQRLRARRGNWEKACARASRRYQPAPGALVLDSCRAPAALIEPAANFVQHMTTAGGA